MLVALAALFSAFVLPFLHPGNRLVYSAAYAAGASNNLASIALTLLSLAVACWAARTSRLWRDAAPAAAASKISRSLLLAGLAAVAFWNAGLGWAVARAGQRYGESAYFLERTRDLLAFGGALYRDVEFPYGPLLLLPPVWIERAAQSLHIPLSVDAAFFAWLTVLNLAGVLLTAFCFNRLPLAARVRTLLFVLFCFEQMHPLMGPNYSLAKFMLPFAVLLWGSSLRSTARQALALSCGFLLTLLVSPELGVGLTAGLSGWAILTALRNRQPAALLNLFAPVAGYALFLALYGRAFLDRLLHAVGGALNLLIEPLPDTLIFLAALAWLAPVAVGLRLRGVIRSRPVPQPIASPPQTTLPRFADGPALAGILLLSLGLLPGALGRADPLHVFFFGFGFLLLSFVGIERLGRRRATLWLTLVGLLCLQVQLANFKIYLRPLRDLAATLRHPAPRPPLDIQRLAADTHGQSVATPALLSMPLTDELTLRRAHLFVPDKTAGLDEIWTPADETAKIARLRRQNWALVPDTGYLAAEGSPNADPVKRLFRFGYRYPQRRTPYVIGRLLQQEFAAHWEEADRFPGLRLMHRIG